MKSIFTLLLLSVVAVPQFVLGEEEDKPIKFEALPAAVAKAIKEAAGDARLEKIVVGDEDGTLAYEAVWKANGHQHEIAVAKSGKVLSLEEIISVAEAPEAIRAAIAKEAHGAKVTEVEKVLEKGKTIFEATLEKGKSKSVVSFDQSGKVLERENPEAEKSEAGEKEEKTGKKAKKD